MRAEAQARGGLGNVAYSLGRYVEATAHYERYRVLSRAAGNRRGEARAIGNLGAIYFDHGRFAEAREKSGELLRIAVEIGDRRAEAFAISNLGDIAHTTGDFGVARAHFERFLALNRLLGLPQEEATTRLSLGYVSLVEGKLEEAERHIAACEERARADGSQRLLADAWLIRGNLRRALGRTDAARADYEQAVTSHRAAQAESRVAEALFSLGRLLAEDGDEAGGALFLGEALKLTHRLGLSDPGPLPQAWLALLRLVEPASVVVPATGPVVVQAEAHVVLVRAGGGEASRVAAAALLERMSRHLAGSEQDAFWRHTLSARAWREWC